MQRSHHRIDIQVLRNESQRLRRHLRIERPVPQPMRRIGHLRRRRQRRTLLARVVYGFEPEQSELSEECVCGWECTLVTYLLSFSWVVCWKC